VRAIHFAHTAFSKQRCDLVPGAEFVGYRHVLTV
jgi:hypothetical protein